MKGSIIILQIGLLLGVVILGSCSLAGENPTVFPATSSSIPVTLYPTSTLKTEVGTPTDSIEATASPPLSPSFTPTPAVPLTATWVPALSKTEAEDLAIELLRNNGGCRLPCFWGFIPGQTNQETLFSFFHGFYDVGGRSIKIPRGNSTIKIFVNWNSDNDPQLPAQTLWVTMNSEREVKLDDGKYDQNIFDNPYFRQYSQYYTLPNLLSIYGAPSKAYFGIDLNREMGFDNLVYLYLDYFESGWGVQFIMPLRQEGDFYIGCPAQAFTFLSLWSPGNVAAAAENQADVDKFGIFKPLEEATNLSVEEFYQQFKGSDNLPCVGITCGYMGYPEVINRTNRFETKPSPPSFRLT